MYIIVKECEDQYPKKESNIILVNILVTDSKGALETHAIQHFITQFSKMEQWKAVWVSIDSDGI